MEQSTWRWAVPTAIFFFGANAWAGSLNVSPIRLDFTRADQVQQLTLGNEDDSKSLVVQVELFRWTQEDGEDVLTPSRDFLATPPLLEIGPGQKRTVRVGPRNYPEGACETSYRVAVTEIPENVGKQPPLRFRTQIRLPVFARQQAHCAADPVWRWRAGQLVVENRGQGHIQYQQLSLEQGEKSWPLDLRHVGYVLPGSVVRYPLPQDVALAPLRLAARTREGESTHTLQRSD